MTGGQDEIAGMAAVALTSTGTTPAGGVDRDTDALLGLAACHDLALEVSRMATFELDAGSGALTWSPSAAAVIGCAAEEVEDHLRQLLAPIAAAPSALRADHDLEQRILTPEGERFVQVRARRWPSTQRPGRIGVFGVVSDVTERRATDQAMVDLVDRYRLLVELSPDGIVVHEGGVVRYMNSATCRIARARPDELLGANILQFMQPDDIGDLLERLGGLTSPGMTAGPTVAEMVATDGTRVKLDVVSVRTTWEGRPAFQVILRETTERDRAEAAGRTQAELVAAVSDAIVAFDEQGVITSWNPAAERIFGWSAAEATGRRPSELADAFVIDGPGDLAGTIRRSGSWSGELVVARSDGSPIPVHASVAALTSTVDGTQGVVVVFSDQSERLAAEAERTRAEARFSTVVAALDEGIAVIGADGDIRSCNAAAERILGRPAPEVARALSTGAGLDPCDRDGQAVAADHWPVQLVLADGHPVRDRMLGISRPDGTFAWLRLNVHALTTGDHGRGGADVVCSFTDVTDERRATLALAHAATHDALTALPNRVAMRTELDRGLQRAGPDGTAPVAVLFCDLDRFKEVNDSLGHHIGDRVLCEVADRLRGLTPAGASVGRLGGDEFIVVATGLDDDDAVRLAHAIVTELCRPLDIRVHDTAMNVTVGVSVGIAFAGDCSSSGADSAELLRAADVALFRAKARGRGRVEVFDPSVPDAARLRLETREHLRVAIESGQLEVHYQPLWQTAGAPSSCTIAGFEALARWTHPVRGPQNPADFIPLAEETGLIQALGTYVLERACVQMAAWRAEGRDLYVSVNLSARQLSDPHLVATVRYVLAETGLASEALWLELTESTLADEAVDAGAVLRDLADLGVRLSIDDFGTGYSSLGRLRHLPVSALKIDRSFVADMTTESAADGTGDGGVIVESTIALAHRLGLVVVAEGVETAAQLAGLAGLDCEIVQGFLLGRPVPAGDVSFTPTV
jgi:diguanylate cyclase (GGDEF)-like protein/PAS domain S-box-containing protein